VSIVGGGFRDTTFRDGATDGSGRFLIMACDRCGKTAEMVRTSKPRGVQTFSSPPGWVDGPGKLDYCPFCADRASPSGEGAAKGANDANGGSDGR
jgi:hypothetical protein